MDKVREEEDWTCGRASASAVDTIGAVTVPSQPYSLYVTSCSGAVDWCTGWPVRWGELGCNCYWVSQGKVLSRWREPEGNCPSVARR